MPKIHSWLVKELRQKHLEGLEDTEELRRLVGEDMLGKMTAQEVLDAACVMTVRISTADFTATELFNNNSNFVRPADVQMSRYFVTRISELRDEAHRCVGAAAMAVWEQGG